jgi:hypothetical protein
VYKIIKEIKFHSKKSSVGGFITHIMKYLEISNQPKRGDKTSCARCLDIIFYFNNYTLLIISYIIEVYLYTVSHLYLATYVAHCTSLNISCLMKMALICS